MCVIIKCTKRWRNLKTHYSGIKYLKKNNNFSRETLWKTIIINKLLFTSTFHTIICTFTMRNCHLNSFPFYLKVKFISLIFNSLRSLNLHFYLCTRITSLFTANKNNKHLHSIVRTRQAQTSYWLIDLGCVQHSHTNFFRSYP